MMMSTYTATMEPQADTVESVAFVNVESTMQVDALNNHTPDGIASARLNASEGKIIGPSLSLHLMNGDTIQMKVFAKYNKKSDTKTAVTDIAAIISGMLSSKGLETEAGSLVNDISNSLGAAQAGLMKSDDGIPKAFLNYLFFDKDMIYKKGGFAQVTEKANGDFEELSLSFIPEQEGYIMVYTSNQTTDNTDVFFDDMAVLHTSGPIVRVDDYYPYGLTYNTSQLSGVLTNKYLYNDKEFQDELGLNLYDYGARFYDPELGRWHAIDPLAEVARRWSPYKYGCDNPLKYIDKDGMMDIPESMKAEARLFGFYPRGGNDGSDDDNNKKNRKEYVKPTDHINSNPSNSIANNNDKNGGIPSNSKTSKGKGLVKAAKSALTYITADIMVLDPTDAVSVKWGVEAVTAVAAVATIIVVNIYDDIDTNPFPGPLSYTIPDPTAPFYHPPKPPEFNPQDYEKVVRWGAAGALAARYIQLQYAVKNQKPYSYPSDATQLKPVHILPIQPVLP